MKLFLVIVLVTFAMPTFAQLQMNDEAPVYAMSNKFSIRTSSTTIPEVTAKLKLQKNNRWRITGNKYLTGGLVFLAGAAKGFNEALQYQYKGFESFFPKANAQWFYPAQSFANKYKNGDPKQGAKFPLSTSVLVMFTDQYHLNNFIQRSALTAALVIKIGEGKKPLKYYLFDVLFYSACHQAGFHAIYSPIQLRNGKG